MGFLSNSGGASTTDAGTTEPNPDWCLPTAPTKSGRSAPSDGLDLSVHFHQYVDESRTERDQKPNDPEPYEDEGALIPSRFGCGYPHKRVQ